ncbi:MAG TPA: DUF1800 domain-containing protein [Dongiaceae bacterium]|nr:DUF1800 domain-containing protein [Dongiaceae bacterium]
MSKTDAAFAAQRFGLGPRPGDLAKIGSDPRGWLLAQVTAQPQRPAALDDLPPVTDRIAAIAALRMARKSAKQDGQETGGRAAPAPDAKAKSAAGESADLRQAYLDDAAARCVAAIDSDTPLVERLVQFWSNHFTVSGQRPIVAPLALNFETDAIRPHVFGTFADMLLASTRHPAMLLYLDNAQSVGPMSRIGAQRARGLNENFAREMMELHTLGVDGGYSQNDVREVAKVLTGWTVSGLGGAQRARFGKAAFGKGTMDNDDSGSGFRFLPVAHEPGDKTVLGKVYREAGEEEGRTLLHDMARHPATARHIAAKLARHFIDDNPPATVVEALAKTYLDTEGDLGQVTRQLVTIDAAWRSPAQKIRTSNDWVIATFRALQLRGADIGKRCLVSLRQMGQLPFMAPSPAGWPDQNADWLSPEALMTHIDLARLTARRVATTLDPRPLVSEIIGPGISPETAFQISNAPSQADALALLLVSPEFMRR